MASQNVRDARAGAVSRALRKAGFGVGYSGGSGYSALSVSRGPSWSNDVTVSLNESQHKARIDDVALALARAGYIVRVNPPTDERRYRRLRSAIVTREGWT